MHCSAQQRPGPLAVSTSGNSPASPHHHTSIDPLSTSVSDGASLTTMSCWHMLPRDRHQALPVCAQWSFTLAHVPSFYLLVFLLSSKVFMGPQIPLMQRKSGFHYVSSFSTFSIFFFTKHSSNLKLAFSQ